MKHTAQILRIEKISPNDGAGLRTVVFFKGCPLRCAWCSTPESQSIKPELSFRTDLCQSCGSCGAACPEKAIFWDSAVQRPVINRSNCIGCGRCVEKCPSGALGLYGKEMTAEQVLRQIRKDEIFYFHSGGGVTLSGGDVLLQADFARELLVGCKESGIHTMAELDMYGDFANIEKLLPWLDGIYVDIKLMDPQEHRKWTGVDNQRILENTVRAASQCRKNIMHIRVPLIPGINDAQENILATARFCETLASCAELEFLPYHRLGQSTYSYLNRPYSLDHLSAMKWEEAYEKVKCVKRLQLSFPVKISGKKI